MPDTEVGRLHQPSGDHGGFDAVPINEGRLPSHKYDIAGLHSGGGQAGVQIGLQAVTEAIDLGLTDDLDGRLAHSHQHDHPWL